MQQNIDIYELACNENGWFLDENDLFCIYTDYKDIDFAIEALNNHLQELKAQCRHKPKLLAAIEAIYNLVPTAPELNYLIKDMHESNVAKHRKIEQNYLKLIKPKRGKK